MADTVVAEALVTAAVVAGTINGPRAENNLARIGRKVINTEKG